jgi:MFS family permease
MDFYRHLFTNDGGGKKISFFLVYLISIIFTFQSLLTAYSSSTYLERFIAPEYVGLVFAAAAFVAMVITFLLPRLLRAIGNVNTTLLLMLLMMLSLVVIGYGPGPIITITAFIAFNALYPQIYLNIDIFLEALIGEEEQATGSKRGLILAVMSFAGFLAPLTMGYLIGDSDNLSLVFYVAAVIGFLCIGILVSRFRHFYDPEYKTVRVRDLLPATIKNRDLSTVMITQFLLQFFYTWAVIYFPLYFATVVGLSWESIGYIIAVGLFAFVIFEYPIGLLADHHWGEKEMMALGFTVLAIASASLFYMQNASVIAFMTLMFFSRFGASLVEVTTESYFFKQVKGHDSNLISLFRLMRPLGSLLGALAGSIALIFFPLPFIFVLLGLVMASGTFITLRLTDSR